MSLFTYPIRPLTLVKAHVNVDAFKSWHLVLLTGALHALTSIGANGQDNNYVVTTSIQVPNVQSSSNIDQLTSAEKTETIQYFDGLGRPIQVIQTKASPLGYDIVQPMGYDEFGREVIQYLPYVSHQSDGSYKPDAIKAASAPGTDIDKYHASRQFLFYQSAPNVAHDSSPFSKSVFEASPLNRVVGQGAPGEVWQPSAQTNYNSTDRIIKKNYGTNALGEVILWKFVYPTANDPDGHVQSGNGTQLEYYAERQLFRNVTKDEQYHEVIEFVDKEERLILKKVEAGGPSYNLAMKEYAETYYVYDDLGNLVSVIQPEGIKAVKTQP